MDATSDLLREGLDGLLHGDHVLVNLGLGLLGAQLDMPYLAALSWIDNFAAEHIAKALCYALCLGHLFEKLQALGINFGVGVIQPELVVEDIEAKSRISFLVLQEVAKVHLLGHPLVMLFKSPNSGTFLESCCVCFNHIFCFSLF